ncbi:hypothetical protein [Paraburkholderia sediminicola]|uniref:hypothetical protein n=1 Tax=Paraburkholderia sediminicola TaxID=458836 RepID=UPI0038B74E1A
MRQVTAVGMMVALDNLSGDFARALLAATLPAERSDDARGRQSHPGYRGRLAKMEQGLSQLQREATELELCYNDDLFYLALASSYVRNWTRNEVVYPWLRSHHPKFAVLLKTLVEVADFAIEPKRPMKLASTKVSEDGA